LSLREEFVAIFNDLDGGELIYLMSPANEVEFMLLEEHLHDFRAEDVRYTSFVLGPPLYVLIGVRPEQIA
jgi:hypothetical protein